MCSLQKQHCFFEPTRDYNVCAFLIQCAKWFCLEIVCFCFFSSFTLRSIFRAKAKDMCPALFNAVHLRSLKSPTDFQPHMTKESEEIAKNARNACDCMIGLS